MKLNQVRVTVLTAATAADLGVAINAYLNQNTEKQLVDMKFLVDPANTYSVFITYI